MNQEDKPFTEEVGRRIRAARLSKGLTQEQLATASCLHRTTIGAAESGERLIQTFTLMLICRGLGLSPGKLLDGIDWIADPASDSGRIWNISPPGARASA